MKRLIPTLSLFVLLGLGPLMAQQYPVAVESHSNPATTKKLADRLQAPVQGTAGQKTVGSCSDKNLYVDSKPGTSGFVVPLSATQLGFYRAFQKFPNFSGKVSGLYFEGMTPNVANSINIAIYDIDSQGEPGTQLGGVTIPMTVTSNTQEWGGLLQTPINVSNGFFLGVVLNVNSLDTVIVVTNDDGDGYGNDYSVLMDGQGDYYSCLYDFNPGFDFDFLFRPVLDFDMDVSFSAPDTQVCANGSMNFLNNSNLQSWLSDDEYSADPTASLYSWDFGDGSAPNTSTNPTHTFAKTTPPDPYNVVLTGTHYGWSGNCQVGDSTPIFQQSEPFSFFSYSSTKLNVTFHNHSQRGETFEWDFGDNGAMSTLENPLYVYPAPGSYPVVLKVNNECGESFLSSFVKVSDTADYSTLSVREVEDEMINFNAFPNPVTNELFIDLEFKKSTKYDLVVFNVLGEQIEVRRNQELQKGRVSLDMAALNNGAYWVRISTAEGIYTRSVIKQ